MESESLRDQPPGATQVGMVDPEIVRQMRALHALRWPIRRIARELGMDTAEMLRLVDSRMRFKEEQLQNPAFAKLSPEDRQKAIDKMWDKAGQEIGTHGEFNALNAALLAREELNEKQGLPPVTPEELSGFVLHNTFADPQKGSDVAGAMARCHNCENLTSGVTTTRPLGAADATRDRHEHA